GWKEPGGNDTFCFLICFSGYSSGLTGPGEVSSPLGESVSVLCQYHERHQGNRKYWCRGAVWRSCHIAVETTGSEAEAKEGRVSIRDNHRLRTFTVTMENLRLGDAGIYWCGISKFGFDPGVPVKVTVLPGETCLTYSYWSTCTSSALGQGMAGRSLEGAGLPQRRERVIMGPPKGGLWRTPPKGEHPASGPSDPLKGTHKTWAAIAVVNEATYGPSAPSSGTDQADPTHRGWTG
uniref:Immunoglobulin domain-containing protein n=1 Tax=Gopherus evgoodei TaxID=1825980 RepID=A0A8C4WDR1_9SAUR